MAIFIFEYWSLWKWILLYFLSILVHSIGDEKKKSLDRKQVRLRQTYVKQIKVLQSICHREKKIIFNYFQRLVVDYYVDPLLKVIY